MGKYLEALKQDVRVKEGLKACLNCGVCTAICPAAEFYKYDPRIIIETIQSDNDQEIEELLKSDSIWYCGECMSCKTRCPRGNTVGMIISALRQLSQELGFFVESEKGRQQFALKRSIGQNILDLGLCIHPSRIASKIHPEQGPIWEWIQQNQESIYNKLGGNAYNKVGVGAMTKKDAETMNELREIFKVTGGLDFFDTIEQHSKRKAKEMDLGFKDEGTDNEYFMHVFTYNSNEHNK